MVRASRFSSPLDGVFEAADVEPVTRRLAISADRVVEASIAALAGLVVGSQFDSLGLLVGLVDRIAADPTRPIEDHHRDYAPDSLTDARAGGSNCIGLSRRFVELLGAELGERIPPGVRIPISPSTYTPFNPLPDRPVLPEFMHAGVHVPIEDEEGPGVVWVDPDLLQGVDPKVLRPGREVVHPETSLYDPNRTWGTRLLLREDGVVEQLFQGQGVRRAPPSDWLNPDRSYPSAALANGSAGWLVNRAQGTAWLKVDPLEDLLAGGVDGVWKEADLSDWSAVKALLSDPLCRLLARDRDELLATLSRLRENPEVTHKRRLFRDQITRHPRRRLLRAPAK